MFDFQLARISEGVDCITSDLSGILFLYGSLQKKAGRQMMLLVFNFILLCASDFNIAASGEDCNTTLANNCQEHVKLDRKKN